VPTFAEMLERFGRGELSRDNVVVMHPDDFGALRSILDPAGEYPHFSSVDRPTIQGTRVVVDAHHPRGSVSFLDAWRPSLVSRYNGGFDTIVSPSKTPSPPEPRSLWERLADDDE
jgi:hypothetical protein